MREGETLSYLIDRQKFRGVPMNDEREVDEGRRDEFDRPGRRNLTPEDIILKDLVDNASRSGAKLRELLAGTILIKLVDTGGRFLIDWSGPELKSQTVGKDATADCTICLSEDHLRRIAQGDLNPQIAMLSEKVRVEGRKGAAMYLFNLIAPRVAL
jgi:putative sterol carrier protein